VHKSLYKECFYQHSQDKKSQKIDGSNDKRKAHLGKNSRGEGLRNLPFKQKERNLQKGSHGEKV
jgi:CRISPR/Cas system-associated protein Cas10 (large subunit of type III CRISPR-Cas system)